MLGLELPRVVEVRVVVFRALRRMICHVEFTAGCQVLVLVASEML